MDRLAWLLAFLGLAYVGGQAAFRDAPAALALVLGVFLFVGIVAWRGRRGAR